MRYLQTTEVMLLSWSCSIVLITRHFSINSPSSLNVKTALCCARLNIPSHLVPRTVLTSNVKHEKLSKVDHLFWNYTCYQYENPGTVHHLYPVIYDLWFRCVDVKPSFLWNKGIRVGKHLQNLLLLWNGKPLSPSICMFIMTTYICVHVSHIFVSIELSYYVISFVKGNLLSKYHYHGV